MITVHVPQNDPGTKIAAGSSAAEEIAANIAVLAPPREPMNPDPTTEEWDEQIRELTRKLVETAEDRDRLREKVIELNRTSEQLSREREAAEAAKRRTESTIADYERLVENLDRERVELKAALYDYIVACGELLPE